MLSSMQLLCFYQQPPSVVHTNGGIFKDKRFITNPYSSSSSLNSSFGIVHALVKEDSESQQYEVEPEKAREALKKLDEQMQTLSSRKQPSNTPKLKAVSEVKLPTELGRGKDKLEISDSFLGSVAGGLLLFTILYNVLFYTVIKPSVDGS